MIPIYSPYLPKGSLRYAHDALDSTWISSKGPYLNKAKDMLSKIYGTDFVLLTNNGTASNHIMARVTKLKYPNRPNLIVPNNVYVAAWNPFILEDFRLWPKDANIDTWNMDLSDYQVHRTHILLAVHNLGNIINIASLKKKFPGVPIIEDNCEGFGGMYEYKPSGYFSDSFTLSFFGNKNITSGEGGAFITYDKDSYEYAFRFHGQGQTNIKYMHNMVGYNYRMTNIQAAILCGQLELVDQILDSKRRIFGYYMTKLDYPCFKTQFSEAGTHPSNWMFGVRIMGNKRYSDIEKFMSRAGIEVRPLFYPIRYHKHLHHENNPRVNKGPDKIATLLSQEVVILPCYPDLDINDQAYIIDKVKEYARESNLF